MSKMVTEEPEKPLVIESRRFCGGVENSPFRLLSQVDLSAAKRLLSVSRYQRPLPSSPLPSSSRSGDARIDPAGRCHGTRDETVGRRYRCRHITLLAGSLQWTSIKHSRYSGPHEWGYTTLVGPTNPAAVCSR